MDTQGQLQSQLRSLEELRTIVKTMKALSAASIRQYDRAVTAVSGYYEAVERGLQVILRDMGSPTMAMNRVHRPGRLASIVFGSDHGLCGRFNEEIGRYALERMGRGADRSDRHPLVLAVGGRVAATLEHEGQPVDEPLLAPGSATRITATVQQILLKLDEWRAEANVRDVYLFYNRHSDSKGYQPTMDDLLPVDLKRFERLRKAPWPSRTLPTFGMERTALLNRLLQQYLFVLLFRACAESQASEHASRLAAMQSAQRNLDERLDEVTMTFRRARQNAITTELLDVVSGFEAISTDRTSCAARRGERSEGA